MNPGDRLAAPPAERLEADNSPLLGRVFEAEAARELALTADGRLANEHVASPASDLAGAFEPANEVDSMDEAILPFLGSILSYAPGASIEVQRRLSLDEDLHLADHAFVYAPDVKPTSACLPVLPMTMSLEAMAEVAACLAPGYGLLGFEAVKAARWIELADTETLPLRLTGRVDRYDPDLDVYYIEAAIYIAEQTSPAISTTALFGSRYLVDLSPVFSNLSNAYRHSLTGEQIYAERHMFHGPSFHCMAGDIIIGDQGLTGEFVVRSPERLFRSTRRPQLLTHPTLLDAVGQIVGVWALEHDRFAFPIGFEKLEIYCPTPPVGTRVPVRVEITKAEGKALCANVEVQNGAGGVWMRISDWRSWKFRWEQRLVDFRRLPHQHLLTQAAPLPPPEDGSVCLTVNANELGNFDYGMLARYVLSMEEMPLFRDLDRFPQRQRQWLLGRIAAKDAARQWVARRTQGEMPHPAGFTIHRDDLGRPFIKTLPGSDTPPFVSISHCEDRAIAVAHDQHVGIDIERIVERDPSTVRAFATEQELQKIGKFPEALRHEWITRLWSAKEAAGKLLGTGIDGKPHALEAVQMESDGRIVIWGHASARLIPATTVEDAGFIISYAG